ncbi:MAG: hypothetical protein KAS04_07365, partial [Candidatus Aenigmarchaeota archaeon]|nr:hypothetical protein [Candidatus Aenigmarchaeota archaeon]
MVLKKFSAAKLGEKRDKVLGSYIHRVAYYFAYEESAMIQNYLNSNTNYPLLQGIQTNLYKCFLPQSWYLAKPEGSSAFITQEGIYNDPYGQQLRTACYSRLKYLFFFHNEKELFDILHTRRFDIHIFASITRDIEFDLISDLFHPSTIDNSYNHDGCGHIKGIKDENNNWNIWGHKDRIVKINKKLLSLCASIYDEEGTSSHQARLPNIHSIQIQNVLRKISILKEKVVDIQENYFFTQMWNETGATKNNIIKRTTTFSKSINSWIISGPHIYVGNPFYKTANAVCEKHHDYSVLDLNIMPLNYLSRTNYVVACESDKYKKNIPTVPWGGKVCDFTRLAFRGMLSPKGERTLITALLPEGAAHINGVLTIAFRSIQDLIAVASFSHSIVADFFIKTTGRSNLHRTWENFPLINYSKE